MSKRNILLALALGVAVGYFANQQVHTFQKVSPEKALKRAKETFKRTGPISGSWIYMKTEEIEKNGLLYNAYRGGITKTIDGENREYEFFVDAETGGIISAQEAQEIA